MSHTHRDPRPLSLTAGTNDCPTGKQAHASRKSAKQHASRIRRTNGEHLRPYRCPYCELWHVGHLPGAVIRGELSDDQHYGRAPLTPVDVEGLEDTGT